MIASVMYTVDGDPADHETPLDTSDALYDGKGAGCTPRSPPTTTHTCVVHHSQWCPGQGEKAVGARSFQKLGSSWDIRRGDGCSRCHDSPVQVGRTRTAGASGSGGLGWARLVCKPWASVSQLRWDRPGVGQEMRRREDSHRQHRSVRQAHAAALISTQEGLHPAYLALPRSIAMVQDRRRSSESSSSSPNRGW